MGFPAAQEAGMGKRTGQGGEPDHPLPGGTGIYSRRKTGDRSADGPQLAGKPLADQTEERKAGTIPDDI